MTVWTEVVLLETFSTFCIIIHLYIKITLQQLNHELCFLYDPCPWSQGYAKLFQVTIFKVWELLKSHASLVKYISIFLEGREKKTTCHKNLES